MNYGFAIGSPSVYRTPENLVAMLKLGEELGYHSVFLGDHIIVPKNIGSTYPYTADGIFPSIGDCVDTLTILAFIAGQTRTLKLVTSVLIVPHRNPIVAAKALATIDFLSNGRLVVGVGVGWMREEFEALGLPPFEERGAVTDEYIRVFKELWTSDNPTFEGKYCRFSDIHFMPKPVQKPHPPIWVGGESPRALRRTAELANGWYPLGSNLEFPMAEADQLKAGLERLGSYARRAGREPKEFDIIYRPWYYELKADGGSQRATTGEKRRPFTGNVEEMAADIRQFRDVGATHILPDFFLGNTFEEGMKSMEEMATKVWPLV